MFAHIISTFAKNLPGLTDLGFSEERVNTNTNGQLHGGRKMSSPNKRKLARIRGELRMRLMTQCIEGTSDILAQLQHAAEDAPGNSNELRNEYERWRLRFEMLAQ